MTVPDNKCACCGAGLNARIDARIKIALDEQSAGIKQAVNDAIQRAARPGGLLRGR